MPGAAKGEKSPLILSKYPHMATAKEVLLIASSRKGCCLRN